MVYRVILTEDAQNDLASLDKSLRAKAAKTLRRLEQSPYYGEPLGNRYGINLSGYFRIRFNNRKHRIVYTIEHRTDILIIAIGPREDFDVYDKARSRIR